MSPRQEEAKGLSEMARDQYLTQEQQDTLRDLEAMRGGGWTEIGGMWYGDLDAMEERIRASFAPGENAFSAASQLRYEALEEIRHRRNAIRSQEMQAYLDANVRRRHMRELLDILRSHRDAMDMLVEGCGELWGTSVPRRPADLPADLDAVTEEELDALGEAWGRYLGSLPERSASGIDPIEAMEKDADVMLLFHDKRIRSEAGALRSRARDMREGRDAANEALEAICCERTRRDRQRMEREEEARKYAAHLPEIVESLQQRIAELEGKV